MVNFFHQHGNWRRNQRLFLSTTYSCCSIQGGGVANHIRCSWLASDCRTGAILIRKSVYQASSSILVYDLFQDWPLLTDAAWFFFSTHTICKSSKLSFDRGIDLCKVSMRFWINTTTLPRSFTSLECIEFEPHDRKLLNAGTKKYKNRTNHFLSSSLVIAAFGKAWATS